jgi:hypothetical protein
MIERTLMPSLLDVEINSAEADAFGHRHFAKALESLIESPSNEPPYSIGLLGKWGTGKSSIKSMYLASLHDDRTKDAKGEIRQNRIHEITFNAWRFGGENIKRALLRHVYLALEGDQERLKDALFHQVQRAHQESRTWGAIFKDAYEKSIWAALQVVLILVFIIVGILVIDSVLGRSNPWVAGSADLIVLICATLLIRYLFDPKRSFVPRYTNVTKVEFPSSSAEEYEDLLIDQLKVWKSGKGKKCERLLIFVDDLDRLSAEEMVSGLDAVRTFMEIPRARVPDGLGIVFVISCDEDRIAEALADRRRQRSADLPGSVIKKIDARRFLDRIFQFRLEIPQFPKRDMRNYAMNRLTSDLSSIAKDLVSRGVSLETLIDRMIHVGVQSPRNALQILNAFAQSWWIAQHRERQGAGTDRPGGLHEGAVTDHPISLAALCALRVDFADFYEDLQEEPGLIRAFTDVFIGEARLEEQPDTTQAILGRYTNDGSLRADHSSLRQYIAALQGLRWPAFLQPLLVLSEDPITRKLGDKGPRLYDAFVSGDHAGVLAELGRNIDSKLLSHEEIRLLRGMQEELQHETTVRRDNAARVVAALAERLPDDQAYLILSPLARRLAESHDLRCSVGMEKIEMVLPKAPAEDRRDVAGKLIDDLLRTEGEIQFTLPSGQQPSLDEAVDMAKRACSLALDVRRKNDLDGAHDAALLKWLETRSVSIAGQDYEFPFRQFEEWVAGHEEHLLTDLSYRYTDLLAAQMETNQVEGIDFAQALRRSQRVFDDLWSAGQDSRVELWDQLNKFVAVRQAEAVALAWELMLLHQTAPDAPRFTTFIKNFAQRLHKDMVEPDWALDWEKGAVAFLALLESRGTDLASDAHDALVTLAISWSEDTATSEFALRLMSFLFSADRAKAGVVIQNWVERPLTDLPENCLQWLGVEFKSSLTASEQQNLVSSLAPIHDRVTITEDESRQFRVFLDGLPDDAILTDEMQKFLGSLYPFVQQQHGNPSQYLYRVFSPLPRIMHLGPAAAVGSLLHNLFTNTKNATTVYGWLHEQMAPYWPKQTGDLSPYDPTVIFNGTIETIRQSPGDASVPKMLASARRMVEDEKVGKENEAKLMEMASLIWPHHQAEALEIFQSASLIPSTAAISSLVNEVELGDENSLRRLRTAWSHFSGLASDDQKVEVSKSILNKDAKGTQDKPDLALALWIESQKDRKRVLLQSLIAEPSLNDSQRKRAWLQVEKYASELGSDFFATKLPEIFALPDSAETFDAVLQSKSTITALFDTKADQYKLAVSLVKSFTAASSMIAKNKLAEWLREIDNAAALKEIKKLDGVTDEDLEILRGYFPQAKFLKEMKAGATTSAQRMF